MKGVIIMSKKELPAVVEEPEITEVMMPIEQVYAIQEKMKKKLKNKYKNKYKNEFKAKKRSYKLEIEFYKKRISELEAENHKLKNPSLAEAASQTIECIFKKVLD
jgi:hypothetical protein